jgi:hypothetical protein
MLHYHAFLTAKLSRDTWLGLRSDRITPTETVECNLLIGGTMVSWSYSGFFGEQKNLLPLL